MGAISELHFVNNFSTNALTLTNLEPDPDYEKTCSPGRSTFVNYQWIPWCSKGSDFPAHHIRITLGGVIFFVWQHTDTDGNWVRLSTTGFTSSDIPPFTPAPKFPGIAFEGGDRNIDVASDGTMRLIDAAP
ncbi:hypothetical protein [[Actinomadura] parvosata]|uniref:hypothetical protein n=1 Tax=[Actinomadura] parvosata TaxID=1955412 RepID=UPI0012BBA21C|nr:hypothetical protein [Nonomuraea sp. ATCC 55076]